MIRSTQAPRFWRAKHIPLPTAFALIAVLIMVSSTVSGAYSTIAYELPVETPNVPSAPLPECSEVPVPPLQCAPGDPRLSIPAASATSVRMTESIVNDDTDFTVSSAHDVDADGIPDVMDPVNLPSESHILTTNEDVLSLPDGLPKNGLALLLEPGHNQAYLLAAELNGVVDDAVGPPPIITSEQALDRVEALQGILARNALAMLLHEDMSIHYVAIVPETPVELELRWVDGALPADGSWLLVHTDPTRLLRLALAGNPVDLAARAVSRFSPANVTDYRWDFINLHSGENFCYDPTTVFEGTDCLGKAWPGWLRAYSGQARNALAAVQGGLAGGHVPLSTKAPDPLGSPTTVPLPVSAANSEFSSSATMDEAADGASLASSPLAARDVGTIFDPASKWHLLGSDSHSLPPGIGVDYLLDPQEGASRSHIQQVDDSMLDIVTPGVIPASDERLFEFEGTYYSIPATPRDINSVKFGIEALDGDPSGQTFLIDGARLAKILDIRDGEGLGITIDANHTVGFEHVLRDVDGDGHQDIIMHIPHFSTAWITLYNANSYSSLQKVVLTSPSTGWITGAGGAVYRYASGQLERYDIPGTTSGQKTKGIHVVSDTEFYVTVSNDLNAQRPTLIAHYRNVNLDHNGWVDFFEKPGYYGAGTFWTVWMNPDQTEGYAGGNAGFYRLASGALSPQSLPTTCSSISALAGSTDLEYVGLSECTILEADGSRANPLLKYDAASGTFVEQNVAPELRGIQQVDTTLGMAVNRGYSGTSDPDFGGRLAVFNAATNYWDQVSTGIAARAVAEQPGTNVLWAVGDAYPTSCECGAIVSTATGSWTRTTYSWLPLLRDFSMADSVSGLAVGEGVMQFREVQPPVAEGTLSATSGNTDTTFTANGAGSYVQEPDGTIAHEWSWGDGITTTGEISTHRYNSPSNPTYTVTHIVRDTKYNTQTSHNFTVTVTSESLTIGTSKSDTFASSTTAEAHHYRIDATGSDRYVQVQLSGLGVSSRAIARLDGIAGPTGAWPQSGSSATSYPSTTVMAGKIPAGQYLDIKVETFGYGGSGSLTFTLLASTLPTPANPTTSLTSGTYNEVTFSGTAPHNGNRLTRLAVDWGDGQTSYYPATGYATPGTTHYASHDYAIPGTRTVTLSSQDDVGQMASITREVTIHLPPQGTATGATQIMATQATVAGHLSSLGGDSSVTAVYRVFNGGTQIDVSGPLVATAVGDLPSFTATGLLSGVSYTYTITLSNDVASSTTAPMAFQTTSPLTIVPQIVSNSGSVALGAESSLVLKTNAAHGNDVAYFVRWDVGGADDRYISSSEIRYPVTGYVPWNQEVTASKVLPFVGAHAVEVRIEDTLLARSNPTTVTMTVTGASPLASFTSTSTTMTSAVLSATIGELGLSPVQARLGIQDPSTGDWAYNAYTEAGPGDVITWTPALDAAKTYQARIDMHHTADFQSWTTAPSQWLTVRTNQAPVLQTSTVPWQVNYLDVARFAVTYMDVDGDAPPATPTMTLDGVTYAMRPSTSSGLDYKVGVEYYYNVPADDLTQGQSYWPDFEVQDQLGRTSSAQGGGVHVARRELMHFSFQDDSAGGLPQGMIHGDEPLNYWHVVNTQASNMPGRLAMGHHGKALWFGDAGTGTYRAPDEGVPRGTLTIPAVDLGQVQNPALSFSSYYETEDKGTAKDVKLLEICTSSCAEASSWSLLHQVSGDEGGYGTWRSQHVSLADYEGQVVQLRFVFDAIDGADNSNFGWFIDDIALGHDHDDDTLPDVLEERRRDILIANQPVPVRIQPGENATSHVRRLVRPHADSFQLEALVSSANPEDLTVTIGVTPSLQDNQQHSFVLYSGGVDRSSCTTMPNNGVQTFNRSAVVERSDGLDIRIDLIRCAGLFSSIPESIFAEGRNWFLHVDVPAGSSRAWIDMLRVVTSGRTDFMQFDTNYDGTSDGTKVNFGRDALGHDADQDGIPNAIDPDDTIPNWAPALSVLSSDYTKTMELSFQDLLVPLAAVKVQAKFNSTQQDRDLSATYKNGVTWSVNPNQYNQFPDGLVVHWSDVYGTKGTVTYYMGPQDTEVFVPKAIVSETVDRTTQQTITVQVSLASVPTAERGSIALGTATPYVDTYSGEDHQGQLMSVIGMPLVTKAGSDLLAAAGKVGATCRKAFGWIVNKVVDATVTATVLISTTVDNVVNGFKFTVQYTREFVGVTANELEKVTQQGKAYLDAAGNIILIRVVNDKYVAAISKSVGDGVVFVYEVVVVPKFAVAVGTFDQLVSQVGYGNFCGGEVTSDSLNPIDELDTSCFIHDHCLFDRSDAGTLPPFSHDPQTMACSDRLVVDATDSSCYESVGAQIGITVPEEHYWDALTPHRYHLPQGGPPLYVQSQDIIHCPANRTAIIDLFALGPLIIRAAKLAAEDPVLL